MTLTPALKKFLIRPPTESGLIYDLSSMAANASSTKQRLGKHHLLIAVKSFPDINGLRKLVPKIDGADISNYNEYKIIQETAEECGSILWLTRCPVPDFIKILNENKKCILWYNVDTFSDLPELKQLRKNFKFQLALRINTSSILDTNHPLYFNSRFGLVQDELEEILAKYGNLVEGIHLHHGSEKNDTELFRLFLNYFKKIRKTHPTIHMFNIGGGWSLQDKALISEIHNCDLNLTLEPGNYFGEDFGYAFSTVTSIKKMSGSTFIEGSLSPNAHLRWTRKIGQIIIPLGNERQELAGKLYYGSRSCDEADRLQISKGEIRKISIGDLIVFTGVSPYSLAWNHSFNGISAPVYMLD